MVDRICNYGLRFGTQYILPLVPTAYENGCRLIQGREMKFGIRRALNSLYKSSLRNLKSWTA